LWWKLFSSLVYLHSLSQAKYSSRNLHFACPAALICGNFLLFPHRLPAFCHGCFFPLPLDRMRSLLGDMLCCRVVLRLAAFLLVSGLIHVSKSYPFGAGLSACKTLIPGHGKEPQPMETLPFMIEPESDHFTPGRIFKGQKP
jgi:hypothetical protein